jgi:predicted lipoprotein with Yx(FWY)xxD motif
MDWNRSGEIDSMKRRLGVIALCLAMSLLAGCGGDDGGSDSSSPTGQTTPTQPTAGENAGQSASKPRGAKITLGSSEFGRMLFNSRKQAIYIFERDQKNQSNCYGECAAAWPPVYTRGEPQAGNGVKASLLGTTKRRDGRLQVTYAGKPLYYYAHEGPGEVKCHNVNLNGGFWWVVGPDGERLQ